MLIEQRRRELARLMLEKVNGLELIMARYTELKGHFPSVDLTPRQIIDAIAQHESMPSSELRVA